MIYRFLGIIVLFSFLYPLSAQEQANRWDNFNPASPIAHPMKFSGTFGELRSNHFHMGIDLKSERGRIGDKIYAIEDGYISRIKVQAGGYGQAVYIDHPQGLTSVYGHLEDFTPELREMVRDSQQKHQTFRVDLRFNRTDSIDILTIKKGTHFAYMGTKGYSFGPHLHMEIRNTETEVAINPLQFKFDYKDNIAPNVYYLLIHHYNDLYEEIETEKIALISAGHNNYRPRNGTIKSHTRYVNFSISTRDKMNNTPNNNGVYKLSLSQNGRSFHSVIMDSISFDATRYLNAYIPFNYFKSHKSKLHRLHTIPVRSRKQPIRKKLHIFQAEPLNQVLILNDTLNEIEITVSDYKENKSTVSLNLDYIAENPTKSISEYNYFLPYNEASIIRLNGYKVTIPEGAIYEDLKLRLSTPKEKDSDCLGQSLVFHNSGVPLHKPIKIEYDTQLLNDTIDEKTFLGNCSENKISNHGHSQIDNRLVAHTYDLSYFCVLRDTINPKITPTQIYKLPSTTSNFIFKITDNVNSTRFSTPLSFDVLLDGKYTYAEFDAKSDRLIIPVVEMEKLNKNRELTINVTDSVGNISTLTHNFKY